MAMAKKKSAAPTSPVQKRPGYGESVKGGRIRSKGLATAKSAIAYGKGKPEEIYESYNVKTSDALVKPRVKKTPSKMVAKKK